VEKAKEEEGKDGRSNNARGSRENGLLGSNVKGELWKILEQAGSERKRQVVKKSVEKKKKRTPVSGAKKYDMAGEKNKEWDSA